MKSSLIILIVYVLTEMACVPVVTMEERRAEPKWYNTLDKIIRWTDTDEDSKEEMTTAFSKLFAQDQRRPWGEKKIKELLDPEITMATKSPSMDSSVSVEKNDTADLSMTTMAKKETGPSHRCLCRVFRRKRDQEACRQGLGELLIQRYADGENDDLFKYFNSLIRLMNAVEKALRKQEVVENSHDHHNHGSLNQGQHT